MFELKYVVLPFTDPRVFSTKWMKPLVTTSPYFVGLTDEDFPTTRYKLPYKSKVPEVTTTVSGIEEQYASQIANMYQRHRSELLYRIQEENLYDFYWNFDVERDEMGNYNLYYTLRYALYPVYFPDLNLDGIENKRMLLSTMRDFVQADINSEITKGLIIEIYKNIEANPKITLDYGEIELQPEIVYGNNVYLFDHSSTFYSQEFNYFFSNLLRERLQQMYKSYLFPPVDNEIIQNKSLISLKNGYYTTTVIRPDQTIYQPKYCVELRLNISQFYLLYKVYNDLEVSFFGDFVYIHYITENYERYRNILAHAKDLKQKNFKLNVSVTVGEQAGLTFIDMKNGKKYTCIQQFGWAL